MANIKGEAIEQLKEVLAKGAKIVLPGDETYEESSKRWSKAAEGDETYEESSKRWSKAAEKNAAIIVFPLTAKDVSAAVNFAKDHNLELVVKGGGHSTSGASSTEGGLCVDLSLMNAVSVDDEKKTISAQGGAVWKDVDFAAAKYGLATVGGTVNHTGVGGLTLGGGFGFLTPKLGLVVDNLLEVEYVLADGRIVRCSENAEPDLFWAARGAGAAFGVATEFVYRAHEQQNAVWGGALIYSPDKLEGLLSVGNRVIMETENEKSLFAIVYAAPPPAFQPTIIAMAFYNGLQDEAKEYFKALFELGPLMDMTKEMPYEFANSMMNEPNDHGSRRGMKGSAFLAPVDHDLAGSTFKEFASFVTETPDALNSTVILEFVPYAKILNVSQTATSFANRGAYGNIVFNPSWQDASHDLKIRNWVKDMADKCKTELERRKKTDGTDEETEQGVGEYMNYDSFNASGETLFGVNYPRLKELKNRYDPGNMFLKPTLV